jgi:hypothetical protein
MLRDLIKGQMTAIECGLVSFEALFMPYMVTNDGRTLGERSRPTGLLGSQFIDRNLAPVPKA